MAEINLKDAGKVAKALRCNGEGIAETENGCGSKSCPYRDPADDGCNILDMCSDAADQLESQAAELQRYRQWVNDLQSGMYINCVYCGHRYGPRENTPVSMADVLKEHIEHCPEHPMSKLKAKNAELEAKLAESEKKYTTLFSQCQKITRILCPHGATGIESVLEAATKVTLERDAMEQALADLQACLFCENRISYEECATGCKLREGCTFKWRRVRTANTKEADHD